MATLVILSIVLFTSTTNALAISNEKNSINDVQETNYTISDNVVILHSLVGDIKIPIPEEIKEELNDRKQNAGKQFEKLTLYSNSHVNDNIHSNTFADFFECNEQAQVALSVHSENYRNWEAFFKRNSISDTIAVSIMSLKHSTLTGHYDLIFSLFIGSLLLQLIGICE